MKIKYILAFVFIIFYTSLNAQYFDLGQEPASIKWHQIKTEHFRIIFSEDFTPQAQRIAYLLEYIRKNNMSSIGHQPKKATIIIHNRNVISNAYAAWAPARMEFFTSSPQTIYCQDWMEQLCLHEYRHIAQMDKMSTGAGKWLNILLGQQATAGLFGLFIPSWFMEGDAVCTETAFSNSGRGRIPDFEMPLKAQIIEKGLYSFDKASFGSFKDFVPGEYTFGYLFVAETRKLYGYDLWNKATTFAAHNPLTLTPLYTGLKKCTGKKNKTLYKEAFSKLDSLWSNSLKYNITDYSNAFSPSHKNYTSYEQPVFLNDTIIAAIKSGLNNERQFVELYPGKKEKKLFTPGFFNPVRLASSGEALIFSNNKKFEELLYSSNGKYLVWTEVQYDKRWTHQTWSVIKKLDINTRKVKTITKHTKYFAPAIAPDNSIIAASEILPDYKFSLVFINPDNGEVIKRFSHPDNNLLLTPVWSSDSKEVYCTTMDKNGRKGILKINFNDLSYNLILPLSHNEISKPVYDKNYILFNGTYNGITNIYAINQKNSKVYRVTSSKYGASWPAISSKQDRIAFSEYTAEGYKIVTIPYDTNTWILTDINLKSGYYPADNITSQEMSVKTNDTANSQPYKISRFRKGLHLFQFHSWMPFAYDELPSGLLPGLTLMSQDRLSNSFLVLNYGYNTRGKTSLVQSSFIYKGFYPVLELKQTYGERNSYFNNYLNSRDIKFNWNESVSSFKSSIPLNLSRGKWYRNLTPAVGIDNIRLMKGKSSPDSLFNGSLQSVSASVNFWNLVKTSDRDLRPRWGQVINVSYRTSVSSALQGKLFSANAALLFPGILKHHSLRLGYGYQISEGEKYRFPDVTYLPRGYESCSGNKLTAYSVDYRFPLLYPDLSIPGFLYIKRIKTNLFFDYAEGKSVLNNNLFYKSAGAELTFDIIPFRAMLPVDVGCRYIYLPDYKNLHSKFELMLSVNFDSF